MQAPKLQRKSLTGELRVTFQEHAVMQHIKCEGEMACVTMQILSPTLWAIPGKKCGSSTQEDGSCKASGCGCLCTAGTARRDGAEQLHEDKGLACKYLAMLLLGALCLCG